MAKKTSKAYPVTFRVRIKVAKEAKLDDRAKAALKSYAEKMADDLVVDALNGSSDGKIQITRTSIVVLDLSIFDLTPKPDPQGELPAEGEEV